jgi:hypothetical protein
MCVADDCCAKCFRSLARAFLIIINLIFWIAGLLMLGLGIALAVAPAKVLSFLKFDQTSVSTLSAVTGGTFDALVKAVGIFMIILGGVVVIIGFFGFFGAACDNKCMLVTYAVFLIIIVLAEVALIIFAAVYPDTFTSTGQRVVEDSFVADFKSDVIVSNGVAINYTIDPYDLSWAAVQVEFQCCGVYGWKDYQTNATGWTHCGTPCAAHVIPITCCTLQGGQGQDLPSKTDQFTNFQGCQQAIPANNSYNSNGCVQAVVSDTTSLIKQNSKIAIGIAAGIAGLEIILIVLAFVVCCCETEGGKYV